MLVQFTTWDVIRNLLEGGKWTLALSLIAFVLGGLVGLLILFARIARNRALQAFAKGYIEVFQGTPLLMQLFLVFFGLPLLGLDVSPGSPPRSASRCSPAPTSPKSGAAASRRCRRASGKRQKAWR